MRRYPRSKRRTRAPGVKASSFRHLPSNFQLTLSLFLWRSLPWPSNHLSPLPPRLAFLAPPQPDPSSPHALRRLSDREIRRALSLSSVPALETLAPTASSTRDLRWTRVAELPSLLTLRLRSIFSHFVTDSRYAMIC
jgi:hypothetical protein